MHGPDKARSRFHRRGSIYLLVIGASMVVGVIGLSSLMLIRVQQRTYLSSGNLSEARIVFPPTFLQFQFKGQGLCFEIKIVPQAKSLSDKKNGIWHIQFTPVVADDRLLQEALSCFSEGEPSRSYNSFYVFMKQMEKHGVCPAAE